MATEEWPKKTDLKQMTTRAGTLYNQLAMEDLVVRCEGHGRGG